MPKIEKVIVPLVNGVLKGGFYTEDQIHEAKKTLAVAIVVDHQKLMAMNNGQYYLSPVLGTDVPEDHRPLIPNYEIIENTVVLLKGKNEYYYYLVRLNRGFIVKGDKKHVR